MNRSLFVPFAAWLLAFLPPGAGAAAVNAAPPGASAQLHALFDSEWERGLREDPTSATHYGDHRFDDRWPDVSPAALQAMHEADRAVLQALDRIDPAQL